MATKTSKGVRTDRFTSKAGDFVVIKPAPKTANTTKSSGNKSSGGKKK